MDVSQYYITTLTTAAMKIGPVVLLLLGGYLVFVRLPFLFLKKSMDVQKKKLEESGAKDATPKLKASEPLKVSSSQSKKEEPKKEEPKKERRFDDRQEKKKEEPKRPDPQATSIEPSPESVFQLKPGEVISKSELKKRYFELLKQNHPDRVASMGQDFKKLAEKNTKDINKAYDKLKSKAS